jgi:quercetin dioxygenase-like cupin family protein
LGGPADRRTEWGNQVEDSTRREFLELATLLGAGIVLAGGVTQEAGATPPTGTVTRKPLAKGRLNDQIKISTAGPTDFHIQHVVLEPGADSGWHTHPGITLDVLHAGTLTAFIEEGGRCEPLKVEAGRAFFVPGGVKHMVRNDSDEPAEVYVTYLVGAGAEPRADADAPASCEAPPPPS